MPVSSPSASDCDIVRRTGAASPGAALPVQKAAVAIALALALYLSNGRLVPTDDAIPARYLPASLLRHGTFALDAFPELYASGRPYYLQFVRGHYVSSYPVGAAVLATPIYTPVLFMHDDDLPRYLPRLEKLAASLIVATSVGVLFLVVAPLTQPRVAWTLTALYAAGTSSFSQSSQALWQHGASQLALSVALLAVMRAARDRRWAVPAGLAMAMAVVCRPIDALLVGSLLGCVLVSMSHAAWRMALGALPVVAAQIWYNQHYFGDATHLQWAVADAAIWQTPLLDGFAGLLFSPGRGLFVYSPALAGVAIGAYRAWIRPGWPLMRWVSLGVLASVLLEAKWTMWWGGACYGPRLLADLTPALILLLIPAADLVVASAAATAVAVALVVWSVGAHAIGAYCGDVSWNVRADVDRHPERLWSWRDNQPVECLSTLGQDLRARLAGVPPPPHPDLPRR